MGFRPHIYKCAIENAVTGFVSNDTDGVHVFFNTDSKTEADDFAKNIIKNSPSRAVISSWKIETSASQDFSGFSIRLGKNSVTPDLLIAPDFAMCPECRTEFDLTNELT